MADITLTVDTSSLRDASKKLDDFGAKVKNMSVLGLSRGINTLQSNIRELVAAQGRGTISGNAYQLGLLEIKRAYEQMGYSSQAATAAVRKYAAEIQRQEATRAAEQAAKELARAQQEAAAAAQRLADRQQQLRVRFQEGYALFTQQRQAMRDLREAYRANIVTLEQYQARLAQIRAGNLSGHINQQAQGMNRMNMLTQQFGYQIGDLFVQIQSGTSFLVAFGQQATQVIGTLAMLATSTKAIAFFSVLGPVLAIGTAIGAYFMRASGATKTLKDRLSELQEVSSNLKENFRTLFDKDLKLTFGSMTDSVRALTEAMLKLNSAAQINRLEELSKKLGDSAKPGFFSKTATITGQELLSVLGFGDVGKAVEDLNEEAFQKLGLSMARSQFFKYQEELTKLAKAGDRQGVVDLITEMTNDATDFGSTADKVTLKGAEMLQQMADAAMLLAESEALLNGSSEAAKQAVELEKRKLEAIQLYNKNLADQNALNQERDAAVKRIVQTRDEELTSLRQQRDLLETTLKFGKDSEEVKAKEAEIARAIYMQEQVRNGILGNNLTLVMDEYDAMAKVRGEVETAADSAKLFADNLKEAAAAMNALTGLGDSIGRALEVATAKVDALKSGAESGVAGTVAGYYYDIESKRKEAIAAGNRPDIVDREAAAQRAVVAELEKKLSEEAKLRDSNKTGGTGGGSKVNPIESLIKQLQTQREVIDEWYATSQDMLKNASESELQIIGGYNEAKLRLEQEYQDRIKGIRDESHSTLLTDTGNMFTALASISEAGGKRALKAQAVLSAAATMIAAYETAVKAAAEAKTIPGRIAAYAGFLASGMKAVSAIRSIGGIGGGTGGVGSATVAPTASAPSPQTVFIDSISPESLYSGETLINLFEAFYDENDKRGKVFMVAR